MDYSIVFDLIWKIVNMILRKNGVFESLAELNIDLSKYILVTDEGTSSTTTTQPASTTTNSMSGWAALFSGLF